VTLKQLIEDVLKNGGSLDDTLYVTLERKRGWDKVRPVLFSNVVRPVHRHQRGADDEPRQVLLRTGRAL